MTAPGQNGLTGRVALVTGGGRGIGRAIALKLAADGADIAVNYRKDADAAADVVAEIRAIGRKAEAYQGSVDVWDDDVALAERVVADFGHVDILVHNAGIASRGHSVVDTDPAEMERVVRTHAFGPHYLSKLLVPQMRGLPRGDIVMISSVATTTPQADGAPYMMGKAALEALAATLALEEREHGIRVNVVAPGLTVTDMGDRLTRAVDGAAGAAELDGRAPFGRVARPEDVADVVAYFVSGGASYLTGQRLTVDGRASVLRG